MKKIYSLAAIWIVGTVVLQRALSAQNTVPTKGVRNKAVEIGLSSLLWPILLSDNPSLAKQALPKRKTKDSAATSPA